MQSAQVESIVVSLTEAPAAADLAQDWIALEAVADGSFFTSWTWIGAWLRGLPLALRPRLLRASIAGHVVGLGLLTPNIQRRHGLIRSRALFLNATGDPAYDNITAEYNGFLVERSVRERVLQAFMRHLLASSEWEELHLNAMTEPPLGLSGAAKVSVLSRERNSYLIDLAKVRSQAGGYLALLGQKARYSVRHSLKGCSLYGDLSVQVADTTADALRLLEELIHLHSTHWNARGDGGAFATPFANAFHRDLVLSGVTRGEIQLVHVRAGSHSVGYLYNFVYRGRVLTYQAGINYSLLPPSASPGLASHSLAVQLNADLGHAIYDFMVGDQQYKRALCTDTANQYWVVLRRDRLKFRLEDALRRMRNRLRAEA